MDTERHYLTSLFEPQSVAIIGASEKPDAIGYTVAQNMLAAGFKGKLFFINPGHKKILGEPCFPSIDAIPLRVDLAVICTKSETVPEVVETCGSAGCRNAIIISAGMNTSGAQTAAERKALNSARHAGVRLIGPESMGIIRPINGLNASFTHSLPVPGNIGIVTHSGAIGAAVMDWTATNKIGVSNVVAMGSECDIDFGEVLDYMVADNRTESIFLFLEGVKNSRRFMSALRAAARCKPVLLVKIGKHPATKFANSIDPDAVFDAALRRAGVVQLATIGQMYAAAQALFSRFRPNGNRLAIITNGHAPGQMAGDHAKDVGLILPQLRSTTITAVDKSLSHPGVSNNPLNILGDAKPARYAVALSACLADDQVDSILVVLTPQGATMPTETAKFVIAAAKDAAKPVVACWMGGWQVSEARRMFLEAGIPVFRTPEPAIDLFSHITNFYRAQKLLLQTANPATDMPAPRLESARLVIETALSEGRKVLSEMESKAILASFQIPIAPTVVARSATEAVVLAEEIGLPVVLKVVSQHIPHKTDAGGVRLNLEKLTEVRDAYLAISETVARRRPDAVVQGISIEPMIVKPNGRQLVIGTMTDPIFGPTIYVGLGGERGRGVSRRDCAVALPPLNPYLVTDLLQSPHIAASLDEAEGKPAIKFEALHAVLLRVSEMVCELPWIREMEISPLIVDETGAVAVDARISIQDPPLVTRKYDHMAIHPYPSDLVSNFQTPEGDNVTVRPIRPEDADLQQAFIKSLSPESRYFRFMNSIHELSPAQLARLTQIDYDREMAFIAEIDEDDKKVELGVVRYATNPDGISCDFAIVISDQWHGRGLARRLMGALIDCARDNGLSFINGDVLAENVRMLQFVTKLGFVISAHPEDPGLRRAVLAL
jgi:acetyltransferase